MLVSKLNTILKNTVCFIISAVLCVSLVTSFAFPAAAGTPSPVTKGEANLNKIQAKTDELAQQEPPSLKQVEERNKGGLNEVQGSADANKMISPEDAQGTTTLKDKIEQALDKVTNAK
ncbi:hypothetical protein C7H19_06140 [Aphanothece hegewaldii CCALA 016]|uniref:Low temperature-induced protein n=1 Tax=Aphanothece hegewaldii CCALA 016 TaxID=2107694 RepID=A0A2T1M047_9CHRO|nr:hypothetical protein [Aphanothece hegewaldii]PSF38051.1 hypothetical protein C7H19_06140 [Aphanothece hegewaldii CCALA 016]